MQTLAGRQTAAFARLSCRKAGAKRDGSSRTAPDEPVRGNRRWDGALWPDGTDSDDAVRGTVARGVKHRAMMFAMAAAAGRKAGVRILREREQRRNQRKREGREQQDG
jgi:hypothetical protein